MPEYVEKRKLILSERLPGRMQDVYEAPDILNLFADGTVRVLAGPAVTRIEYFRTTNLSNSETNEMIEEREVFLRLTVPTSAYLEAAGVVLASMGQNVEMIRQANDRVLDIIKQSVQQAQNVKL
jgi:hypothetical protein